MPTLVTSSNSQSQWRWIALGTCLRSDEADCKNTQVLRKGLPASNQNKNNHPADQTCSNGQCESMARAKQGRKCRGLMADGNGHLHRSPSAIRWCFELRYFEGAISLRTLAPSLFCPFASSIPYKSSLQHPTQAPNAPTGNTPICTQLTFLWSYRVCLNIVPMRRASTYTWS